MADEQNNNTETNTENTSTQTDGASTVTMTQEKLDSLINGKFAKGAEKATSELLASIGVDDIDVLKSMVTTQRESEEASKSELQKLQEQIELERGINAELESKLNANIADSEIQNLAIVNGINPEKMKYFKMDYVEAKSQEGFEVDKFMSELKEKQPDFFSYVDERQKKHIPNPPSKTTPTTQIKMSDYSKLPAVERAKYKSSDLIRD